MSFCEGAQQVCQSPPGGWSGVGNDQNAAFLSLTAAILDWALTQFQFECEGRECRNDIHALCESYVELDVTALRFFGTTIHPLKAKKVPGRSVPKKKAILKFGIFCVYEGQATVRCRCAKPVPPPKNSKKG